jgi:hypothetical protein
MAQLGLTAETAYARIRAHAFSAAATMAHVADAVLYPTVTATGRARHAMTPGEPAPADLVDDLSARPVFERWADLPCGVVK